MKEETRSKVADAESLSTVYKTGRQRREQHLRDLQKKFDTVNKELNEQKTQLMTQQDQLAQETAQLQLATKSATEAKNKASSSDEYTKILVCFPPSYPVVLFTDIENRTSLNVQHASRTCEKESFLNAVIVSVPLRMLPE